MRTGWENQSGYHSREKMGVVTYLRGLTYIYALQFYLPMIARFFPVRFTDKLKACTVIYEVTSVYFNKIGTTRYFKTNSFKSAKDRS
jgi:hypothetical protein